KEREGGGKVEVARRGRGEDVGAPAVLFSRPMSASVLALTSGVVYELCKADITRILDARPELRAELDRAVAQRPNLSGDSGNAGRSKSDAEINVATWFFERIASFFAQSGGH